MNNNIETDFEPLPCPFCGSSNVRVSENAFWDDDGEHDGVECLDCDALNRLEYWNMRYTKHSYIVEMLADDDQVELAALK